MLEWWDPGEGVLKLIILFGVVKKIYITAMVLILSVNTHLHTFPATRSPVNSSSGLFSFEDVSLIIA
jgi:hypothetical protein